MEIHFLQVKFYSIGVYLDPEVVGHLQQWKGKPAKELEEKDEFFDALITGEWWCIIIQLLWKIYDSSARLLTKIIMNPLID